MTAPGDRVPPGQTVTAKWPVLTYGPTPRVDTARWEFRIFGAVERERRWAWEEFVAPDPEGPGGVALLHSHMASKTAPPRVGKT